MARREPLPLRFDPPLEVPQSIEVEPVEVWAPVRRYCADIIPAGQGSFELPDIRPDRGGIEAQDGAPWREHLWTKELAESEQQLFQAVSRAQRVAIGPKVGHDLVAADALLMVGDDKRQECELVFASRGVGQWLTVTLEGEPAQNPEP